MGTQAVREGKIAVAKQFGKDGEGEAKEEQIFVLTFREGVRPAEVEVAYGRTVSHKYQSWRVDVSVRVPCFTEEIESARAFADKTAVETRSGERRVGEEGG